MQSLRSGAGADVSPILNLSHCIWCSRCRREEKRGSRCCDDAQETIFGLTPHVVPSKEKHWTIRQPLELFFREVVQPRRAIRSFLRSFVQFMQYTGIEKFLAEVAI